MSGFTVPTVLDPLTGCLVDQGKANSTSTRRDEAGEAEPLPSPLDSWGSPGNQLLLHGDPLLLQAHLSIHCMSIPAPHEG